jgi:hypothetical protein
VNTKTAVSNNVTLAAADVGAVALTAVGAANGVAPLDNTGKISTTYLPASVLGAVIYQGTFVPGTTTLPAAASGNKGWYYIATANGTYTPPSGTLLTFSSGDWIISNGTDGWSVVDSNEDVKSVNGKTGAVVIAATDITTGTFAAAQLGATPGNNDVLTTNGSGVPTWVATLTASQLPTATAAALGVASAGTGLSVTSGAFSVNTSVLTMDEGTYTGA